MRMNLAIGSPVNRFLAILLAHPERFQRSEVPCCLQALWEEALADLSANELPQPAWEIEASRADHTCNRVDACSRFVAFVESETRQ